MSARIVQCAKLNQELPGIDEETAEGDQALKMCLLLGGPDFRQRVHDAISAQAWAMWKEHMIMVVNEFRLDPTSDQANAVLHQQMEAFLFGGQEAKDIPNYVPPSERPDA